MTRKDYELIAKAFREVGAEEHESTAWALKALANRLADGLVIDNPLFDRARFLKACAL